MALLFLWRNCRMCLPKILSNVFMFAFVFYCRSFSLCWPLTFLTVSQLLWVFMFFFLQNSSLLLLFLSNNVEKDTTLLLFFLSKSLGSHAIFFPNKTLSYIWVAIPVDWIILHWYVCGADGRSGGRCTVTWLPNFLGWAVYHISLPMVLRCARLARESSAMMMMTWVPRGMRIHQDRREPCMQY